MQEKIAFRAIFYSGGCKVYGVEAGEFSRTEPQSAPQNAMSVIGDPAEQDRCGKSMATISQTISNTYRYY